MEKPAPTPPAAAVTVDELMTNWVELVTDTTVEPAGILGPATTMPAVRPEVLVTVTVLLFTVVVTLAKETWGK